MINFIKRVMKRRNKLGGFFVLLFVCILGAISVKAEDEEYNHQSTYEDRSSQKIIKVAYVESDRFVRRTESGYAGYCVDYFNEIAKHAGWKIEYISGSWEECLEWVESGTIDLACMMEHDEAWEDKFLYSHDAFGTSSGLIYAPNDADIYYQEYKSMDGMSISMLPQTIYDERLDVLEGQYDIKFERVYCDDVSSVIEAMESGETDLAILGSIFGYNGAKVVGKDDAHNYYCITAKDNEALMAEFDEAMRVTKLNDTGVESRFYQRYYEESMISSSPLFTREEHEYIENAGDIVVKLMAGTPPLCYENDGELAGIFVSYLELLAEKSGLNIGVTSTSVVELNDETENIKHDTYLTLRSNRVLEAEGLAEGLINTATILDTQLTYVKRADQLTDTGRDDYTFAVTHEMDYYLPQLLWQKSDKYVIKYYDSAEACVEAVADGQVDIAVLDDYVASYILQKPRYAMELAECPGEEVVNGMCLIGSQEDRELINILNKTVNYISDDETEELVALELKESSYHYSLEDIIYEYWVWLVAIVVVVVLALTVYIILNGKLTNMKVQKKEYEILEKKVREDEVTGVYNKQYFYDTAKNMIDNAEENMCIAMMDITNFKVVNDLYGMENGDKLLRYVADEIKKIVRKYDGIVARFNADHFYICMKEKDFNADVFPKRFKKTVVDNMDVSVTYGVFVVGDQKDVPVNIMCDRASMAAHERSDKESEYIYYYSEKDRDRYVKQKEIESDMEEALEQNQFCVYVQPKYDIYNKEIIGGEALARWIHPEKGMISPGEFIPVFEKNGFIRYLDYYIWEETCKVISEIKKRDGKAYPVSINVSRAHFYNKDLKAKLQELLEKYNLEPSELELEITETICVDDSDVINKRIKELQDMGFKIAMDDFGSGYSSLNMLKEIPLDIIKMDLRFLDSEENVEKSHKILGSLVDLAKSLDLYVVVEGVETKEQVEFLESIGGLCAQGFYFSRPVDSKTYESMVGENSN